MKHKVLVTGAGALLGQGIIRALRRSLPEVQIAAVDPSPLAAGLYWAHSWHLIPLARDESYVRRLEEILAQEQPHLVIPGTDAELPVLAAERSRLEARFDTRILVSDSRVVRIADDKFLTWQFLREAGFDPPDTAPGSEADALIERVGFPLTVKPRVGARSVGVSVARNRAELESALAGAADAIVQEHVGETDTEYTAGSIHFEGEPVVSIVMRRDLRDGNTYRAYVDSYPELNASVVEYTRALRPRGPANFQFRVDASGRPRVFEINARFSGTTPLRHLAGFAEVAMCVRHVLLGEPLVQPVVEPMTIVRYWSEQIVPRTGIGQS